MRYLLAEEQDAALVRAQQAVGELEQDALAHAGWSEQDAGLPRRYREADVLKDWRAVEGDGDVAKGDNRSASASGAEAGRVGSTELAGRRGSSIIAGKIG